MTLITLKQYIRRALGAPLINVEIHDDQMNDRINDAFELFVERHYDGIIETAILITVEPGKQDYTIPNHITAVTGVYTGSFNMAENNATLLPIVPDVFGYYNEIDMVSMDLFRMQIATAENAYKEEIQFDFNGTIHTIHFFKKFLARQTIALRAYRTESDALQIDKLYDNRWFKQYCIALCKIQWGQNLKKYNGVPLPGGGTLNGDTIYSDGVSERDNLVQQLNEEYNEPPAFFIG